MRILLTAFVCISFTCHSQLHTLNKVAFDSSNSSYADFVISDTTLYVLTEEGQVLAWGLSTLHKSQLMLSDPNDKIISLAKSKTNEIYLGSERGKVYKLNPDFTSSLHLKTKFPVRFLVFNSDNKLLLIVPNAIYDPQTKRHWTNFKNHTTGLIVKKHGKRTDTYFQMPHYIFVDSRDKLWMIASFGEFGGDVQIFDTRQLEIVDNKFDSISPGLFFPKSVFEDTNGNVFITSGLQHFSSSGEIYKIKPNQGTEKIFASSGPRRVERKTGKVLDEGGMFIGPGAFNKIDSSIYFATSSGIYKSGISHTGKIENPQLLINPDLTWSQEPLAIGASMAVKKMIFTNNGVLVFLTKKDGIGIYDNKRVTMLK